MKFAVAFLLVVVFAVTGSFAGGVYPKFPLYKQCDPRWGNDQMGVVGMGNQDDTICHQGCAMSSLSMALAGFNFTLPGGIVPTPKTLNAWLRKTQGGYICLDGDCCNLNLSAPNAISPTKIRSLGEPLTPFVSTLQKMVDMGLIVLAHVRNQHHFVLVTGYSQPDVFTVLDPAYDQDTYKYAEIHDILLYDFNAQ